MKEVVMFRFHRYIEPELIPGGTSDEAETA
jgi:hypothetical protein